MRDQSELKRILKQIDGKGYKSYKKLKGSYDFCDYILTIEHVQSDPFAPPSRVRVRVPQQKANFPQDTYRNKSREIALRDYLTRQFFRACKRYSRKRGSGNSGLISIQKPGQEILERNCMIINKRYIEARFGMGLPAVGRRIVASHAKSMFLEEIPRIVRSSLFFENLNKKELYQHIEVAEDADYLRSKLDELGLVAFIADGSILPRASGIDPQPLDPDKAIPFRSPPSLRVTIKLPNRGEVTGMGIPKGVTLIVGGGYHGKTTLLRAIELGIYNHIPGDGRELVVTNPTAIKIRAEDGRFIESVDISPFIRDLPLGKTTSDFSTENASGSTSQAANIIEALEIGAKVLLIDEDTSAMNFMIRDSRMQKLVPTQFEPIVPFIDRVRQLYEDLGVSTVLVMGGSGEYFEVADHVICMINYEPHDFGQKAKQISKESTEKRKREVESSFPPLTPRVILPETFTDLKEKTKITVKGLHHIKLGKSTLDLSALEQLVEIGQTRALAAALRYLSRYVDGKRTIGEIVNKVVLDIKNKGLDVLGKGDFAEFRALELASALNRFRSLKVKLWKRARWDSNPRPTG